MSFRDIVLALTDVALLVVYVAGILHATTRLHVRRRASMLVILALATLIAAKLATFSLGFWARSYSAAAMVHVIAYVKMGNTVLSIFAIAALVSAVYAEDEPTTAQSNEDEWADDSASRLTHVASQAKTHTANYDNPFRAPD